MTFTDIKAFLKRVYQNKKALNILFIIAWIFIVSSIIWASWSSRDQLAMYLDDINSSYIIGVLGFYLLALIFAILGWISIIRIFTPGISDWTHVQIYLISFVSRRLPGTIWYIGGRAVIYERLGVSKTTTVTASTIELVVGFLADCIIGLIFLPISLNPPLIWYLPIACVVVAGLLLIRPASLRWIMEKIKQPIKQVIPAWKTAVWILIRLCLILAGGLMIANIIKLFSPLSSSDTLYVIAARAIAGLAGYLTYLLPSSLGASDLTTIMLLSNIIPVALATVVAVIIRIFTTFCELVLSAIFYLALKDKPGFSAGK